VPCAMNIGYAKRDPLVSLTHVWGAHDDIPAKEYSFRHALNWLSSRD
jgi:hypothetical protein